jgi:hypothetical protein
MVEKENQSDPLVTLTLAVVLFVKIVACMLFCTVIILNMHFTWNFWAILVVIDKKFGSKWKTFFMAIGTFTCFSTIPKKYTIIFFPLWQVWTLQGHIEKSTGLTCTTGGMLMMLIQRVVGLHNLDSFWEKNQFRFMTRLLSVWYVVPSGAIRLHSALF